MGLQTRTRLDGTTYEVWKPERMPLLPPDNLAVCFFLYPTKEQSERGEARGGCGFFVGTPFESRPGKAHLYAITNGHLIDGAPGLPTIRVNKVGGGVDHFETMHDEWSGPCGRDFRVRRMSELRLGFHQWRHEDLDILADASAIADYGLGLGDDVFAIGRFIEADGRDRKNLPLARFGNISRMEETELEGDDFPSGPGYLVEMRSRTGFSGSVVYVYIGATGINLTNSPRRMPTGGAVWVLGLHSAQLNARGPAAEIRGDRFDPPSTSFATAITHVVPAHAIKSFILNDPQLVAARKAAEESFETTATFGELE